MIGQTISHYRVTGKLGEGGMGVVYEAEDLKLRRTVALKFLPPELSGDAEANSRFVHEAQAAAILSHPNICNIHEIDEFEGQAFIAMECYEGETLKERMARGAIPLDEAVDIARQMACGLARAHAQDIIHRDVKPANIIITHDGQVKVMDFGLAKLADQTRMTRTGSSMGTVAYMSPEQAGGHEVDHRSDIFSLGVLMYEIITGQHPFPGDQAGSILYGIVHTEPASVRDISPEVPEDLQQIVGRAMMKSPDDRYQQLEDLIADLESLSREGEATLARAYLRKARRRRQLRWALYSGLAAIVLALFVAGVRYIQRGGMSGSRVDSLAVLPLANLTGDAEQEILVDGLTGELIARLARIGSLDVISSRAVMEYKDTEKPLLEIAGELGVAALLEGSVQLIGDRVRLTVELLDPAQDDLIWGDTFSSALSDVLTLQSDMVLGICRAIEANLTSQERQRVEQVQSFDPAVQKAYLMGERASREWSTEAWKKGIEYFNQAIDLDVTFAPAYAGLARCYGFMDWFHDDQDYKAMEKAAAAEALRLDESLPEAHLAMGNYLFRKEFDWEAAEAEFQRALELAPGHDLVHQVYGAFLLHAGRQDECIPHLIKAKDLDPLNVERHRELGLAYVNSGRPEEAIPYYYQMRHRFPGYFYTEWHLSVAYSYTGRHEQAIALTDSLIKVFPDVAIWNAPVYARAGRVDEAFRILDEALTAGKAEAEVAPYYVMVNAIAGDNDQALVWASKIRPLFLSFLNLTPLPQSLRVDPRYQELMRSIGITN